MLDFRITSRDTSDNYLGDGLADELATRLAQAPRLTVISRTSVKRLQNPAALTATELGQKLRSSFLVGGSVRRSGARIRITAELLRASDGVQLWSRAFDAGGDDVFAIQDQIGLDVATQITGRLLPAERAAMAGTSSRDPAAMEAFVRARSIWKEGGSRMLDGIRLLNEAIRRDSGFAAAHALLARFHGSMYHHYLDRSPARLALALHSAERAVRLAPALDEAHVSMALYHYWGHRDYTRALQELDVAMRLNPRSAEMHETRALVQRRLGLWDASIASAVRYAEYDPIDAGIYADMSETYLTMRRFDDAERALVRVIEAGIPVHFQLAMARYLAGNVQGAREMMRTAIEAVGNDLVFPMSGWGYTYRSDAVRFDSTFRAAVLRSLRPSPEPERAAWFLLRAGALGVEGRAAESAAAYDSALVLARSLVSQRPDDDAAQGFVGVVLARLGKYDEALVAGQRAVALLPVSKDAFVGHARLMELVEIEILAGRLDSAVSHIEQLLAIPSRMTKGMLQIDPLYTPLRAHPRFRALIED